MMSRNKRKKPASGRPPLLRRFLHEDSGSFSVEAVIWMPIFAIILAVVMNISMVFFGKSQILRVVQDANRAYSLGRLDTAADVQNYVLANLAYMNASMTVETTIDTLNSLVTTDVITPATDLMPLNFMTAKFKTVDIEVWAQHIIEF
jgi:Flp pilus assembly protein TadG